MTDFILLLLVGIFVGAAAGYLGSFMVLKRMSLVGDALSHVALPGLAIAIALQINPFIGAFVALTIAVIGIWYFQQHTTVYPEALVGVFFTASLAIGLLITPEPELLEALFGDITKISLFESLLAVIFSSVLISATYLISRSLLLGIISEDLATSVKVRVKLINLFYLLLVGSVVALGVKFVGTLLTGALVIIPAASAKNFSRSLNSYYLISLFFGIISAVSGVLLSSYFHTSPGPLVVLSSITLFLLSYFYRIFSH